MAHLIHVGQKMGNCYRPNEARAPFRQTWLGLLALAIQFVAVRSSIGRGLTDFGRVGLLIGSAGLLLLWIWLNRRWYGVWLIGVGLVLNLAIMLANGGLMPVNPDALSSAGLESQLATTTPGHAIVGSKDILLRPDATRLAPLRDRFVLRTSKGAGRIFSLGDLLLYAGFVLTLIETSLWILRRSGPERTVAAG
ncbi:MAG: DUF5317 domain-containing protein [Dehalococcoidia bacterium]